METADWQPTAAYLYLLHLDRASLAWEYLRRNDDYRRECIAQTTGAAHHWGLSFP